MPDDETMTPPETGGQDRQAKPEPVAVATVCATELLGGSRVLQIRHRGEIYTLRITRNDRLILTK